MNVRITLATIFMILGLAAPANACGPVFERAFFTYSLHPSPPFEDFAQGRLGILQPTYARSYLAVAHRVMAGHPLDEDQQREVTQLWMDRITFSGPHADDTAVLWLDARASVVGDEDAPTLSLHRDLPGATWGSYLNCTPDAFETAAQTLQDLVIQLGAANPHVRDWVHLQDQVFANCGGDGHVVPRLEPGHGAAPPKIIRAHRAYQAACACFYAEQFTEAQRRFDSIARDPKSPWAALAPYLAARAAVRQASLAPEGVDLKAMGAAETRIAAGLSGDVAPEMRPRLIALMDYAAFRAHPDGQLHGLAARLSTPEIDGSLRHLLDDYTRLLDRWQSDFATLPAGDEDLTEWVLAFQGHRDGMPGRAFEQWTESGSSAWLIAALVHATPDFDRTEYLLAGASALSPGDPAYPTAAYHQARLLSATGRPAEAREVLDAALELGTLDEPARNTLTSARLALATDLDEFVALAPRRCAGIGLEWDWRLVEPPPEGTPLMIDADAARLLGAALPLELVVEVARRDTLPTAIRRDVAISAWIRATLLQDHGTGVPAAQLASELDADLAPQLEAYLAADDEAGQHHAAVFALLQLPGATPHVPAGLGRREPLAEIDSYRENWWSGTLGHVPAEITPLPFLDEAQAEDLATELEALRAAPIAPDYLCEQAIALADAIPDDPRSPQALHLAVRATRYSITGEDTGTWSRRAFEMLHREYPDSPWAEQTPYWYK
jgi:hypothetical protein